MKRQEPNVLAGSLPPEQLLTAIVASSDDAIISKDLNGTIMSWNDAAQRIFGYSPSEVLGRSITLLIPQDRQEEETFIISRLCAGQHIDHFETVRRAKDGRLLDISVSISPIRDSTGKIVGASKIARDITGHKLAQQALHRAHEELKFHAERLEAEVAARTAELRESLQELETFSSSIPHDIKGPPRAISAFAGLLRDEHADEFSPEARDLLERISDNSSRLQRFVDNVLSYVRMRRGAVELQRVELTAVVQRVLQEYPHARQTNAEVLISEPLLPVLASEALLMQCIANLISNAVKFVRPGIRPLLKIWTEPREANVRLWIQDNGIGIREKDREKIFGLFIRLHSRAEYDGTGVGLAVVQRAVARMNGTIGVDSEPGQGSRFWIQVKAAPPREVPG